MSSHIVLLYILVMNSIWKEHPDYETHFRNLMHEIELQNIQPLIFDAKAEELSNFVCSEFL